MAQTPAAVQAELGTNPMNAIVLRAYEVNGADATTQAWYVKGQVAAPGRERWCVTTAADDAATQAAAILTQLRG
jgi:hypothetical protein